MVLHLPAYRGIDRRILDEWGGTRFGPNKRGLSFLFLGGIRVGVLSESMIMSDASDPWDDMHSFA